MKLEWGDGHRREGWQKLVVMSLIPELDWFWESMLSNIKCAMYGIHTYINIYNIYLWK